MVPESGLNQAAFPSCSSTTSFLPPSACSGLTSILLLTISILVFTTPFTQLNPPPPPSTCCPSRTSITVAADHTHTQRITATTWPYFRSAHADFTPPTPPSPTTKSSPHAHTNLTMDAPISSPAHNTRGSSASSFSSSSQPSPSSMTVPVPAPRAVQPPSTDAFLKDFTLVAEAAKRAQVAVMVRDFENCAL